MRILYSTIISLILIFPRLALAQQTPALEKMKALANGAGFYTAPDRPEQIFEMVIGNLIEAFLGLLGVIFIGLIIYAGYNWMTAAGEEQKVTKAKNTIQRAIVGLILTASAFGIWEFIYKFILAG